MVVVVVLAVVEAFVEVFGAVVLMVDAFFVVVAVGFLVATVVVFFWRVVNSFVIRVCSFLSVEFSVLYDSAVDFRLL